MAKFDLHIVALPYLDLKPWFEASDTERIAAFYDEAMGRTFTFRVSEANNVDVKAVIAYDWKGRRVGYVKDNERMMALAMMSHSGRKSLRGRVAVVNAEHKCLTVEVQSDWDGKQFEMGLDETFLKWHYSGPMMKETEEMESLCFMMDEIDERLEEMELWTETDWADFHDLMENFCRVTKLDISAEMINYRKQLTRKLEEMGMKELALKVELENGHAGRESKEGDVNDYWLHLLTSQGKGNPLYAEREKYCVADIENELKEFPDNLYNTWVNKSDQFVSKAYYMHIPKQVLWGFLSGIAFVQMMREGNQGASVSIEEEKDHFTEEVINTYQFDTKKMDIVRNVIDKVGWKKQSARLAEWMRENSTSLVNIEQAQDVIAKGGVKNVSNNYHGEKQNSMLTI